MRIRRLPYMPAGAAAFLAVAAAAVWYGSGPAVTPGPAPARLVIAESAQPNVAPLYLAAERGYFAAEGLRVEWVRKTTGRDALEAVLAGEADVATTAETPVVFAVCQGRPAAVLATYVTTETNVSVVARRDRGIETAADLRGRRLGVTRGTNREYFADALLLVNGVPRDACTLVDLAPETQVAALLAGEVDAVSAQNPYAHELRTRLGAAAVSFYSTGFYTETYNLAVTRRTAQDRPAALSALVRAVQRGCRDLAAGGDRGAEEVARRLGRNAADVRALWQGYHFRVGLDQSLLACLEEQARWANATGRVSCPVLPDFREALLADLLASVDPQSVTIFR